ncbi:hypothetical protein QE380_003074 [Acinetobacter baylyi]|uniref:Uncharacterized protein n=1 Tax=Acinetobacter baylyi TaxID=202950 RepID=A0ABU0V017_ACIBI|nr:hypothetical protein [Acinetobacter baylyi]MDR6106254.1 hypothetical protein [Acinetobacter baylyi]MDR6187020.1 hypothetical protein [Acinetobacter baylyi]
MKISNIFLLFLMGIGFQNIYMQKIDIMSGVHI